MNIEDWPALAAARAPGALRVPFVVDGRVVGSVAAGHLPTLRRWPQVLGVELSGVTLVAPAEQREQALHTLHVTLRDEGLIRGWRGERFALVDPISLVPLLGIERAASRFWGTLTFGAHATGYVADAQGRPQQLWIAQRSPGKATDPGLCDNLVGGGVPAGQNPWQALVREGFEEAGLTPAQMQAARPGRILRLDRCVPHGHQLEDLHAFDLELPAGLTPRNQDGEVERFLLLPVAEALALAASERMTVDASLVTLDFALRHGLIPPESAPALSGALRALFAPIALGAQNA